MDRAGLHRSRLFRSSMPGWTQRRLRITLLLFFTALAIPTGALMLQAYSQLKWEAFYQHRLLAEELVDRIDQRLAELIEIESERAFTDYTFLNVAGDASANVLQRSPLAGYPVGSSVPGVVGYFQVDQNGHFSSPLLPDPLPSGEVASREFGLSDAEISARSVATNQVYRLLSDNNLLAAVPPAGRPKIEADAEMELSISASISAPMVRTPAVAAGGKDSGSDLNADLDEEILGSDKIFANEIATEEVSPQASISAKEKRAKVSQSYSGFAQSGFDKLNRKSDQVQVEKKAPSQRLGQLKGLKLEQRYRGKLAKNREVAAQQKAQLTKTLAAPRQKGASRREQNLLPLPAASPVLADTRVGGQQPTRVSMFESEIEPFNLGLLDSGHFVLYRNAWHDGQRTIQGVLMESGAFINAVIAERFLQTNLAQTSELTIAYQGSVLSVLSGAHAGRYLSSLDELQGTLLLQTRLSAPLDGLELVFSITTLPPGPGAILLNWLSLILLLVMAGGFLLMYRLGLRQLNLTRQQQDFVSAVSHELKTPLTSIRMYGEMLREGWATEEKKRTYYDYIYDESDRLTRLINNVLQLANLTRNDLQIELTAHSVAQVIDTLRSKISTQIEHAGFELHINVEPRVLDKSLLIDIDSFCQIVINLVDNAIKFSRNATQRRIDIDCMQLTDSKLQFTIRDYGPGIPADQMRRIFQLFYRSENELTRESAGTGIGLALVHQLVLAMDGQVDVVNANPGAAFKITFPVVNSEGV